MTTISGAWMVAIGRLFPDREDGSFIGLFATRDDAVAFIDEAHDPSDPCEGDSYGDANDLRSAEDLARDGDDGRCHHMNTEDVEDAEIVYLNVVPFAVSGLTVTQEARP